MSPYIRLFYIWVFLKPKYGYINRIRPLVLREKGIWLRKWKKIRVCFSGHYSRAQGWSCKFLSSTFLGNSYGMILDFFLFMFPWVMNFYLKWGLKYCIPIYWSGRNFLRGFLPLFKGFFHIIFGVLFCGWIFLIFILERWLLLLSGCYYCGGIF